MKPAKYKLKNYSELCSHTDVLYCVALKQAVGILWLQGLLILHRAEPPGVVNDAAEPHA